MLLQSWNPSEFWSLVFKNILEPEQVWMVPWHFHICWKVRLNAILGIEGIQRYDNQLIDPELKNIFAPFNFWKDIFNFMHRPSEFPGNFVQGMVVYD